MVPALILVISLVALMHFGVYYWRSLVAGVAAQPLTEQMGKLSRGNGDSDTFELMICVQRMCPELQGHLRKTGPVRAYYLMLSILRTTLGSLLPSVSNWTHREMGICARYVEVVTDEQLRRNLASIAAIRAL